jgi:hypothetical protein
VNDYLGPQIQQSGGAAYDPDRDPRRGATTMPVPVQPGGGGLPAKAAGALPGGYGGTQIQPYTAQQNLRGSQIAPGANPALNPIAQSNTAPAMQAYGRAGTAIGGAQATSGEASGARAMAMGDLAKLGGPDRGQIAGDVFQQMRDASQPQFEDDLRNVGRDAAKFGRLGAGMTTSRLGDVVSNRERDLSLAQRGLASDAASQTLQDRLGVFDARLGASGQFTSEDLGRAGFGLDKGQSEQSLGMTYEDMARRNRGEAVGERDFAYGRGIDERNELRGERGFQNDMQQQAQEDMIRQRMLEEQLLNGEWGRDMDYMQMLNSYGYGG